MCTTDHIRWSRRVADLAAVRSWCFAADRQGNVAMMFAFALPLLLLGVGTVIDFAGFVRQRAEIQAVIDAASLAAAKELALSTGDIERIVAVVEAVVDAHIDEKSRLARGLVVETRVTDDPLSVHVRARATGQTMFGSAFGVKTPQISVGATAQVLGHPNICVLALADSGIGAISFDKNARVTGEDCAIFSNSTHPNGIKSKNSAVIEASLICSAGGKDGTKGNFTPDPLTDCPQFEDPLSARPEPQIDACTPALTKLEITSGTQRLSPGTYCGGLHIGGNARVTFDPGVYAIEDGALEVTDAAEIDGENVGFFLTGSGARFLFEDDVTVSLTAPKDGPMAGLLFFGARGPEGELRHEIRSNFARTLIGTIYLPRGDLVVDADNPVADQSAYTAIVARRLEASSGPHIVLHTDYDLTDVPVPDGIKGVGQPIALSN
ncbi:MAG: TadE/TadG family type IV pilus assembly protein [Hyphomicrobiaceae bacterium]